MIAILLRYWYLAAIAALCAALMFQQVRVSNARAASARAKAELADTKTAYAQAAQKAEVAARAEETRRESEKQKVIDEARTQTAAAQSAALDADAAALGLRKRVAALVASRATGNPSAAGGSAPADPAPMLADVLGRIDEAAGRFAAAADTARIAGKACEDSYGSLTTKP